MLIDNIFLFSQFKFHTHFGWYHLCLSIVRSTCDIFSHQFKIILFVLSNIFTCVFIWFHIVPHVFLQILYTKRTCRNQTCVSHRLDYSWIPIYVPQVCWRRQAHWNVGDTACYCWTRNVMCMQTRPLDSLNDNIYYICINSLFKMHTNIKPSQSVQLSIPAPQKSSTCLTR